MPINQLHTSDQVSSFMDSRKAVILVPRTIQWAVRYWGFYCGALITVTVNSTVPYCDIIYSSKSVQAPIGWKIKTHHGFDRFSVGFSCNPHEQL